MSSIRPASCVEVGFGVRSEEPAVIRELARRQEVASCGDELVTGLGNQACVVSRRVISRRH